MLNGNENKVQDKINKPHQDSKTDSQEAIAAYELYQGRERKMNQTNLSMRDYIAWPSLLLYNVQASSRPLF